MQVAPFLVRVADGGAFVRGGGGGVGGFTGTSPLAGTLWHVVVTVADPLLLCAVSKPPLLTDSTLALSDCQSMHVDVTSRMVPSVKMPIAVTCAVAPGIVNEEKSAAKEKTTPSIVGTRDGVGATGVEDEPHAAANRLAANRLVRRRFIVVPSGQGFSGPDWLVLGAVVCTQPHK
jgi:hypothetical protein